MPVPDDSTQPNADLNAMSNIELVAEVRRIQERIKGIDRAEHEELLDAREVCEAAEDFMHAKTLAAIQTTRDTLEAVNDTYWKKWGVK